MDKINPPYYRKKIEVTDYIIEYDYLLFTVIALNTVIYGYLATRLLAIRLLATHGYCVDRDLQSFSSLIRPEEIEASGFDYLALGHVHVFSFMEHGVTKAAYCGSPNKGLGKDDMSAALVELNPQKGVFVNKLDLLPRTF